MEVKMLRMIVKVYPDGGIATECTDLERTPQSSSGGNTHSNREALVNVLNKLDEKMQAKTLETFPILKSEITEVELFVPHTAKLVEGLGFYQVGEILQP